MQCSGNRGFDAMVQSGYVTCMQTCTLYDIQLQIQISTCEHEL